MMASIRTKRTENVWEPLIDGGGKGTKIIPAGTISRDAMRAGVYQKRRQVFAEHLLTQNKTAVSKCFHRLLALQEPVKLVENDG
jgi:hypothetical protein